MNTTDKDLKKNKRSINEKGIYIHIPFCVRKCAYCDFLSAPADGETIERYVRMLIREIGSFQGETGKVKSVFVGGGTPSVLEPEQILRISEALRGRFSSADAVSAKEEKTDIPGSEDGEKNGHRSRTEITVECNPGTLSREKLAVMREAGVNRLSIGLQSMHDRELKILGRIHDRRTFLDNYALARKMGFDNINIDLMSGLPGQTLSDWQETLQLVTALHPEHISAYSLIIEEGTPFYRLYHEQDELRSRTGETKARGAGEKTACSKHLSLPDEEEERNMDLCTQRVLTENGMRRYEISNYALPGYESIHNSGYWKRTDYIGFGLGAASMLNNTRFRNTDSLPEYLAGKTVDQSSIQPLSLQDRMEETMFLGLRMMKGVSEQDFFDTFGVSMGEIYGNVLKRMQDQGLMASEDGYWFLTHRGIDVSNVVMAEFLF